MAKYSGAYYSGDKQKLTQKMKSYNQPLIKFRYKKLSTSTILIALLILGACKKNLGQTKETPSVVTKEEKTTSSPGIGSGWTEITSNQEAIQKIHLQNEGSSIVIKDWNGGGDPWYINSGNIPSAIQSSVSTVGYSYNSADKAHTFYMIQSPGGRSEIRVQDNYDTGTRQFEGVITIGNGVFEDNAVFQIWGGVSGRATLMQIRGNAFANGGQLDVVQNGSFDSETTGNRLIATNILNKPTRINIIHKQETPSARGRVLIYVEGVLKFSFLENQKPTNGDLVNYMKYGNYGRESKNNDKTNSVVKWSNVRLWQGGTEAAGTGN
jgi:hypothetical protein